MKILVDVDGVIADTHTEWIRRYNHDWHDTLKSSDITRWATHEFVKPECGTKIYDYLWDNTLYDNVLPIKGSQIGIDALRKMGHRCIFLTSGLQPAKIHWLHRYGFLLKTPWQSDNDFVIAHDKSLVPGDLLIDDYPVNLYNFEGNAVLYNQAWNQECNSFPRMKSWKEIVKCLQSEKV